MRIILFLLIIFLLPGGNLYPFSGNNHPGIHSHQDIKTTGHFKNILTGSYHDFIANNHVLSDEKWFDCEDVDDEDTSEAGPRKSRSHANSYSNYYYLALLNYHSDFPKVLPSIWCQPSCRYILLRTFRV
jgi:hypothetical protein